MIQLPFSMILYTVYTQVDNLSTFLFFRIVGNVFKNISGLAVLHFTDFINCSGINTAAIVLHFS